MKRGFTFLIVPAALVVCAASPPGLPQQRKPSSLSAKKAEPIHAIGGTREILAARQDTAIAELCPDNTLSSGQRNCERLARMAVDAEPPPARIKH